jgi:hypothetical protein
MSGTTHLVIVAIFWLVIATTIAIVTIRRRRRGR